MKSLSKAAGVVSAFVLLAPAGLAKDVTEMTRSPSGTGATAGTAGTGAKTGTMHEDGKCDSAVTRDQRAKDPDCDESETTGTMGGTKVPPRLNKNISQKPSGEHSVGAKKGNEREEP